MQTVSRQYLALTGDVGFVELPARTVIELTGADRATLLHNLCTADVQALQAGQGVEAFFTDVKGKVLSHVFVLCSTDAITLDTTGSQAESLMPHLDRYIIREDVQIQDRSAEFAHLLLSGLHSPAAVGETFGDTPTEMLAHTGDEIVVVRSPMVAPPNFLLRLPTAAKPEVVQRLQAAGAVACEPEMYEALRIETGFPVVGTDISDRNLPQEVGRDAEAISFTKGCYLGQETVARLDALGHVNWMLAGLRAAEAKAVDVGTELEVDGHVVARACSSAYSPQYDALLLLAYVRAAHAKPGTELLTTQGAFVVEFVVGRK